MSFGEDTLVVNRTTKSLDCTYDGVPIQLKPGYKREGGKIVPAGRNGDPAITHLIFQAAEMCRRQHVVMGTENPYDMQDVQYLVGIAVRDDADKMHADPKWPNNSLAYLDQSPAVERFDRSLLPEKDAAAVAIPGRGGVRSRGGAGGNEPFRAGNDSPSGIDTRG